MVDLANDLLRMRKTAGDPTGWQMFARQLGDISVPKELVDKEARELHILHDRSVEHDERCISHPSRVNAEWTRPLYQPHIRKDARRRMDGRIFKGDASRIDSIMINQWNRWPSLFNVIAYAGLHVVAGITINYLIRVPWIAVANSFRESTSTSPRWGITGESSLCDAPPSDPSSI